MVTCPTCGAVNADEATMCATCGNSLAAIEDVGVDDDVITRAAYIARALQTAAIAIVAVCLLAALFGVFRGAITSAPTQLNRFERICVGIAEQTIPAYLLALLVAVALALLPWIFEERLPWPALAKAPIVLTTATVGAVVSAIAATVNVRANLIVQKASPGGVTWAFKWKLAAYLEQVLGLSVVIVILCAVGLGMTRRRATDFGEPILPPDAHGHEDDHVHSHDHVHGPDDHEH